jgi:hypothetical protein
MEDNKCCSCKKLSICNLGLGIGLTQGLAYIAFALIIMYFIPEGKQLLEMMAIIYTGYDSTFAGAAYGFVWGFVTGYIYGAFIAIFYNLGARLCPCKYCKGNKCCCK